MTRPIPVRRRSGPRAGTLALACAFVLASAACGGGGGGGGGTPPPTLDEIEVTPASPSLAKGRAQTFTATARYGDASTQDVTALATWTSSTGAATMAGAVATGAAEGEATVSASYGGRTGEATLTVTAPAVAGLTLSPVSATLAAGLTLRYRAVAVYTDGAKRDVTADAPWTAAPESVATIAAGGLAAGVAPGGATVSASYGGVSAETALTVTDATLVSLSVSPSAAAVPLGVAQAFTAVGIFSDGTRQDLTAQVVWTSTLETVATVSTGGVATPVAPGATTLSAVHGGVSDSTTLEVTAATLDALEVDPPAAAIAAGTSTPFTAAGLYSDGSTADLTALATWSSSDGSVATVSNDAGTSGLATGVAAGAATAAATFGGQSGTADVTVTSATLVAIAIAPQAASAPAGTTERLAAIGTYSDGSTQDLTALAGWSSTDPAIAAVSNAAGEEGVVTAVAPGSVVLTAAHEAVSGTATFTVTDVTLVSVDVAPATGTLPVGYTLRYRATARYSDLTTRDVTAEVTWQSSTPAAATISNALGAQGLATGVAAGETAITATLPGVTGAATLTVTEETLASIAVEPNPFSVAVGGKQQLIATGTFSLGTALDVTRSCTWSTSANRIARVSQGGLASGIAAGEVTITAKKKTRSVVTQGSAAGTVY